MPSIRSQVLATLAGHLPALRTSFGVASISLFGSVARSDDRPDSDVDLLVEFDRPVTLFDLAALQSHLSQLLGRHVDVGTPGGLRERVRDEILRECVRVA